MDPELEERLSALLDGELSPEEEAALRGEIAESEELRRRLVELSAVDGALRGLAETPVPAALRERVRARIAQESAAGSEPVALAPIARRRSWPLAIAALAAGIAAVVVLGRVREPSHPTPPEPRIAESDPRSPAQDDPTLTPEHRETPALHAASEAPPEDGDRDWIPNDLLVPDPVTAGEPPANALAEVDASDAAVVGVLDLLAALDELEEASG